jgi:hypothetical protein
MLVDQQVDAQRPHPRSPTRGNCRVGGEGGGGRATTPAAAGLGHVFGDFHTRRGDVEHLPAGLTGRAAAARSAPQPAQHAGRCQTTASGCSTCRSVEPGEPGCLPGFRPVRERWDCLRACRNARSVAVSDDGGSDEFDEFRFNSARSSAMTASNSATFASNSAIRCCSPVTRQVLPTLARSVVDPHTPREQT